ncbi:heme ABC transporter ATP-binding protein [Pseudoalteromonas sp. McH1-7]|uniref:heme ABC transporter ATP-binding protein n=1 Tax=Pseudoalteromonas TaxID=53246 RepID=UPI00158FB256|nr:MULTISPECIES: heme ABC transporter ATP-binding protein [Pseudoalteromonas]MDW7548926.1 heme ABC transporter ATP-binding protein [Pseudoalteromonas peptidolytica]NUZ11155.1 heme ABC transporter ATP-binding protein [Pseudoalteromonas sp. McH1-7]
MLIANKVSVQVGKKSLLSGIDFAIRPGEVAVVLGPNGAGKSTLLKALCGDITLSEGTITYHQQRLHDIDSLSLSHLRAVLTQQYDCEFPFSVQEIVDMAHYVHQESHTVDSLRRYSKKAMQILSVEHLAQRSFTRLSGGEKQRVQFARVLCQLLPSLDAKKPCYLMIDEPTASLDLYHQYQVMKLAQSIAKQGAGVIAVVHDLALAASFADTVYLLEKGKLVASGAPAHVLNKAQLRKTYGIEAQLTQSETFLPTLGVSREFDLNTAL